MVFGNMGDDSGHRRRLHARPQHGREGALRRVPDQRPGRGRRGRHPHRAPRSPRCRRDAGRLRRVPAHRPAARAALPRRPGPRVHHRARPAVHAPDARRQADRGGGREDRRRHGRGGPHLQGGGRRPHRAGPGRPAAARPVRPRTPARAPQRIAKGLNASPGAAVGRAVFDADDAVAWVERGEKVVLVRDRDVARRLPRHGRGPGHPDRPRRRDVPRRGRGAPDRQALRRRLRRAGRRLRAPGRAGAPTPG